MTPKFYDISIDEFREVTQADVDLWLLQINTLALLFKRLERDVADTRLTLSPPSPEA